MESLVITISQSMCAFDWAAAANWAAALATVFAAFVALQGINAWRQEHVGKTKYELARNILRLIHQIKGVLGLEPLVYKGSERLNPKVFIDRYPNEFVSAVLKLAETRWTQVDDLITDLYLEGLGSRGILGMDIAERVWSVVSSLRAANPNYKSIYTPTLFEMGGEKLTPEQWSQRVKTNAILKLPGMLDELEDLLSKQLKL